MSFEPENKLEESLMKAAKDPAHRPQFYRDFLEADIFIIQPTPSPEESGLIILEQAKKIAIQSIEFNGKPCLPIFSSLPRLQAVLREEAGYLALNTLEFLKITQGAGLVLNPGSDYGKEFSTKEIQSLLDGSIWQPAQVHEVEAPIQVQVGQPANYPHQLTEALTRLFKGLKEVKAAYLAHFFNPAEDEKPHTLIGIEVTGDWDRIVGEAGLVAKDIQIPDPPLDFMQIKGEGGSGIEDYFLKECRPFYKRKLFGLF